MSGNCKSEGENLFEWVCRQGEIERAIACMAGGELRALHAYLNFLPDSGIPGLVRQLVRERAAENYLNPQTDP